MPKIEMNFTLQLINSLAKLISQLPLSVPVKHNSTYLYKTKYAFLHRCRVLKSTNSTDKQWPATFNLSCQRSSVFQGADFTLGKTPRAYSSSDLIGQNTIDFTHQRIFLFYFGPAIYKHPRYTNLCFMELASSSVNENEFFYPTTKSAEV